MSSDGASGSLFRFFKRQKKTDERETIHPPTDTISSSEETPHSQTEHSEPDSNSGSTSSIPPSALPDTPPGFISAPNDISKKKEDITDNKSFQPNLNKFPVSNDKNAKGRAFSAIFYNRYMWIEYSKERDAVFCKYCRHFSKVHTEDTFINTGFRCWKKTSERCNKHKESRQHQSAEENYKLWKANIISGRGDVVQQLDQEAVTTKMVNSNRQHIKTILEIVLFCAKQELPLRGHREYDDDLNRGNFLELYKYSCKLDPSIKQRADKLPRNSKMLSPEIQNGLLEAAASLLLRNIKDEVSKAEYYAILADEYKDNSKQELVCVSLRYLHNKEIQERAVGFHPLVDLSAVSIAQEILNILSLFNLDREKCVAFAFDGASVMSGTTGGVQAILKRHFTNAVYVHCKSHRLNLVLSSTANSDPSIKSFFDLINQVYHFMTGSKRHAKFIDIQKMMHTSRQPRELQRACETRWSSWSNAIETMLKVMDAILETLAWFSDCQNDLATRTEASGILLHLQTKKTIFLLVAFSRIYDISDFSTKGLQSENTTIDTAVDLIEGLKDTLREFRGNDNTGFSRIVSLMDDLAKKYDITEFDTRPLRRRRIPNRLQDAHILETVGSRQETTHAECRRLWYFILDQILGELDKRFSDENYNISKCAEACRPTNPNFMKKDLLLPVMNGYMLPIPDAEITVFHNFICKRVHSGKPYPTTIEVLDDIDKEIFGNIYKLYCLLITIPQTSCTVERIFSTASRIKTRLRSSMVSIRFNNLTLLSFESDLSSKLDLDEIIDIFTKRPRRLLY